MHPILIAIGCWLMPSVSYSLESDSLGLPGDNFDLYGAMELFKNAESLEDFEKAINTEKNQINNLDLNADDEIDYVRVVDHVDGDAHAITMEVAVNESESQTIAVFEIEKTGDDNAGLQLIGDEDMYGADYIIEPYEESDENATEMPSAAPRVRIVVNVWGWRPVRFIYGPRYTVWVSPWRWANYPRWYRPWRPVRWHVHYNNCRRYRVHHVHRVNVRRHTRAHNVYRSNRRHSATAHRNHKAHAHPSNARKNVSTRSGKSADKREASKKQSAKSANHNTTRRKSNNSRTKTKTKKTSSRSGKGTSRSGSSGRSRGSRR